MPDGQRDTSSRSSPSRRPTLILVALGDRSQRNLPAFALIAQPRAKAVRHGISSCSVRLQPDVNVARPRKVQGHR